MFNQVDSKILGGFKNVLYHIIFLKMYAIADEILETSYLDPGNELEKVPPENEQLDNEAAIKIDHQQSRPNAEESFDLINKENESSNNNMRM